LFWKRRQSVSAPDTSWPIALRVGGCRPSRDVFPLTVMTALLGGGEDMSSVDVMIGPPIELWVGLVCTAGWSGALLVQGSIVAVGGGALLLSISPIDVAFCCSFNLLFSYLVRHQVAVVVECLPYPLHVCYPEFYICVAAHCH
jgi:hypothetical protein